MVFPDPFTVHNRQIDAANSLVLVGQVPELGVAWYRDSYVYDSMTDQGIKYWTIDRHGQHADGR